MRSEKLWGTRYSPHRRLCTFATVIAAAVSVLGAGSELAYGANDGATAPPAGSGDSTNQALLKKLEAMDQRIKSLEAQVKQQKTPTSGVAAAAADTTGSIKPQDKSKKADAAAAAAAPAPSSPPPPSADKPATATADKPGADKPIANKPGADKLAVDKLAADKPTADKPILGLVDLPVAGLSIGAYGEVFFGTVQNPAAGGQWQNSFDARRVVLLPTYAITENIIFNAEIEFEHAGAGFDNDDKLHGTAEIEQVWVDFKFSDPVSWRAPGVDLVPIGYINQHHEPTQFYSVLRPELYNGLIPSTWKVPATSIYGTIVDGIKYQVMLSAANEDFGDAFDLRTDARTVPAFPIPYFPGVDGLNALAFSNPPLGDFQQLGNNVAVSGRVDFALPQTPGLAWSVSAYYAPNIEPRGAHGDLGNLLGATSIGRLRRGISLPHPADVGRVARRRRLGDVRQPGQPARQQRRRPDQQCRQEHVRLFRRGRRARSDGHHHQLGVGSGAVLPLYQPELSDRRFRRDGRQHADRRRTNAIPQRRRRHIPVAEDRPQGDLSEGDQQGSGGRKRRFPFLAVSVSSFRA